MRGREDPDASGEDQDVEGRREVGGGDGEGRA